MPEPEIARRCPSCGASFREQAFFCPQCGMEIPQRTQRPQSSIYGPDEPIIIDGATLTEADFQKQRTQRPETSIHDTDEIRADGGATLTEADFQSQEKQAQQKPADFQTLTEADFQSQQEQSQQKQAQPKPAPPPAQSVQPAPPPEMTRQQPRLQASQRALGEVGARIHRATTRARDVEENVVQRVQKFREISSVVIDEAGYDPSLRFVLVAGALFVLFLVILLLNKLIG